MELTITLIEAIILIVLYFILKAVFFYYQNKLQSKILNQEIFKKTEQLNKNLKIFNKRAEDNKQKNNYIG
ncbi:MAG: hypothetical protein AABY22_18295 [Nanoarchaeota archaeon]